MTVIFENSRGWRRQIAEVGNWTDALRAIHEFLTDHHYTAPYWRYSQNGAEIMVDVGSHSEFFYVIVPENFCLAKEIR